MRLLVTRPARAEVVDRKSSVVKQHPAERGARVGRGIVDRRGVRRAGRRRPSWIAARRTAVAILHQRRHMARREGWDGVTRPQGAAIVKMSSATPPKPSSATIRTETAPNSASVPVTRLPSDRSPSGRGRNSMR